MGQANPAGQVPEQLAVVSPATAPYVPFGQSAVHTVVVNPAVAPYVPALIVGQPSNASDARPATHAGTPKYAYSELTQR